MWAAGGGESHRRSGPDDATSGYRGKAACGSWWAGAPTAHGCIACSGAPLLSPTRSVQRAVVCTPLSFERIAKIHQRFGLDDMYLKNDPSCRGSLEVVHRGAVHGNSSWSTRRIASARARTTAGKAGLLVVCEDQSRAACEMCDGKPRRNRA